MVENLVVGLEVEEALAVGKRKEAVGWPDMETEMARMGSEVRSLVGHMDSLVVEV